MSSTLRRRPTRELAAAWFVRLLVVAATLSVLFVPALSVLAKRSNPDPSSITTYKVGMDLSKDGTLRIRVLPEAEVVQGLSQIILAKPSLAFEAACNTTDAAGLHSHYDAWAGLVDSKDSMAHHQAAATAFADAAEETAPVIGLGRRLEGIKDRDAAEMLPLERPISADFAAISFYLPRNAARLEAYRGAYAAGEAIIPQPIPAPVFTVRTDAPRSLELECVPVLRV